MDASYDSDSDGLPRLVGKGLRRNGRKTHPDGTGYTELERFLD